MAAHLKGTPNPFGLADPPDWWLKRLEEFDNQLVIFPSQKHPWFKLTRRARTSRGIKPADVPGVENHPDTVIMCVNGLVPVTNVFPGAIWDERVFEKLAERDTWRLGGHKRVSELLEKQDEAREKAIDKQIQNDLLARGTDAYAAYKYRSGSRVSLAHKGAANNKKSKPQHFDQKPKQAPRIVLAS